MISSTSLSVMVWMAGHVSMASWRLRIQSLASLSVRAENVYDDFRAWSLKVKNPGPTEFYRFAQKLGLDHRIIHIIIIIIHVSVETIVLKFFDYLFLWLLPHHTYQQHRGYMNKLCVTDKNYAVIHTVVCSIEVGSHEEGKIKKPWLDFFLVDRNGEKFETHDLHFIYTCTCIYTKMEGCYIIVCIPV